jgi:hypothetical protein
MTSRSVRFSTGSNAAKCGRSGRWVGDTATEREPIRKPWSASACRSGQLTRGLWAGARMCQHWTMSTEPLAWNEQFAGQLVTAESEDAICYIPPGDEFGFRIRRRQGERVGASPYPMSQRHPSGRPMTLCKGLRLAAPAMTFHALTACSDYERSRGRTPEQVKQACDPRHQTPEECSRTLDK